jgi:hypothetical protein
MENGDERRRQGGGQSVSDRLPDTEHTREVAGAAAGCLARSTILPMRMRPPTRDAGEDAEMVTALRGVRLGTPAALDHADALRAAVASTPPAASRSTATTAGVDAAVSAGGTSRAHAERRCASTPGLLPTTRAQ